MVFALSVFELHIPHARSLKDKRKVVRGLVDRLHRRHRVSIAETDLHDLHQRCELAIAAVARDRGTAEGLLSNLRDEIESRPEAILVGWEPELMEEKR